MKQRTISTSSSESLRPTTGATTSSAINQSGRDRKKSMNDSGKCSTLSHHVLDEEDYPLDSLDVVVQQQSSREMNSPHHQTTKSIQTSKHFSEGKTIVFPECKLPNLDFVHLEHEVLTSQFATGDQFNQRIGQHPPGFDHIVDWDSLLFLLSREHKEMLKRYPVVGDKIRNSIQESVSDMFDEFPERISIDFDRTELCDCDSLISSAASTNSSNRYSSDSGLGPNAYNFDDLRKLFVYEYNEDLEAPVRGEKETKWRQGETRHRERRATLSAMQSSKPEKKVSFEAGLPKKRSNKSTSSIPRLITKKTAQAKNEGVAKEKPISKIPKLIKSRSQSNVVTGRL